MRPRMQDWPGQAPIGHGLLLHACSGHRAGATPLLVSGSSDWMRPSGALRRASAFPPPPGSDSPGGRFLWSCEPRRSTAVIGRPQAAAAKKHQRRRGRTCAAELACVSESVVGAVADPGQSLAAVEVYACAVELDVSGGAGRGKDEPPQDASGIVHPATATEVLQTARV